MKAFIETLKSIVGAAHVLTDDSDRAPYEQDWRGRYEGRSLCVVHPGSTEEVSAVVTACAEAGMAIVPQGGNTGLVGGGVPHAGSREVVLGLARLDRIRALDGGNFTLTVEAGCTLAAVQAAASEAGLLFPLSLASEGSCQIGGNLATNAGGVHVLRYGNTRDLTLGLEVVLPDGRIWNGLRGLRKDNTGYDLKQLFIGSEGTLGIITAAVLKLFPAVHSRAVAWVAVSDVGAAVALLGKLRTQCGERLSAFELVGRSALQLVLQHIPGTRSPFSHEHDWHILVELSESSEDVDVDGMLQDALDIAIDEGIVRDAAIASGEAQRTALWALRENISEAQKREGYSIKHDISVPVSHFPEFLAQADDALSTAFPGLRIVTFGHVGDGNLHYNMSKSDAQDNLAFITQTAAVNRIVHDLVAAHGGSISAEHGLGQLKREEILRYKPPVEIALMRSVKAALDPQGLMNPGKLL